MTRYLMTLHRAFFLPFFFLAGSYALAAEQPANLAELEAYFDEQMQENEIPGAQALLIEDGVVVLRYNHGFSDLEAQTPVTDETLFRAGSISKAVLGVASMIAVEQGIINLDQPIRDAIPDVDFTNRWEDTQPVRLVHVLEHTAGFYDISLKEFLTSDANLTLEQGLAIAPEQRISRWPPGSRNSYSNSGPVMAALALERASGQSFDSYVTQHVFQPLGMNRSSYRLTSEVESTLSKSYRGNGDIIPYGHISMPPSGALNTNTREFSQFLLLLLNRGNFPAGRMLSEASVDRIETAGSLTASAEFGHPNTYGLGNNSFYSDKHVFRGHDGGIDGFSSVFVYSSQLRSGFMMFINGGDSAGLSRAMDASLEYLTRNYQPVFPPPYPRDEHELAEYAGSYVSATPRNRFFAAILAFASPLEVTWSSDSGLVVSDVPRIPNGPNTFRRVERPESSFAIFKNYDDKYELQFSTSSYTKASKLRALAPQVLPLVLGLGILILFLFHGISWLKGQINSSAVPVPEKTSVRRYALGSQLLFIASMGVFAYFASGGLYDVGPIAVITPVSIFLFLGTGATPLLTLTALYKSVAIRRRHARYAYLNIIVLCMILSGQFWLAMFGWFPLRTWTF